MSKEKKLSLFFKLEVFFKCPFIFKNEAQKADSRPVWVEGLVEWWASQRVVRADLPGGAGGTWTWQPVFWRLQEPEAGGATVQNQLVCGSMKRCAHLCWGSSCPGLTVWLLLRWVQQWRRGELGV